MALACPLDLDTGRLRHEIQAIYGRVAADPSTEFHFHRGPEYAAARLGYDPVALATLPPLATASFAGVANPLRMAPLPPGATVVDVGCGAGMDLLLCSARDMSQGQDALDAITAAAGDGTLNPGHFKQALGRVQSLRAGLF